MLSSSMLGIRWSKSQDDVQTIFSPGGGVRNLLKVGVCTALIDGFLGPKFSKQRFLFETDEK